MAALTQHPSLDGFNVLVDRHNKLREQVARHNNEICDVTVAHNKTVDKVNQQDSKISSLEERANAQDIRTDAIVQITDAHSTELRALRAEMDALSKQVAAETEARQSDRQALEGRLKLLEDNGIKNKEMAEKVSALQQRVAGLEGDKQTYAERLLDAEEKLAASESKVTQRDTQIRSLEERFIILFKIQKKMALNAVAADENAVGIFTEMSDMNGKLDRLLAVVSGHSAPPRKDSRETQPAQHPAKQPHPDVFKEILEFQNTLPGAEASAVQSERSVVQPEPSAVQQQVRSQMLRLQSSALASVTPSVQQ